MTSRPWSERVSALSHHRRGSVSELSAGSHPEFAEHFSQVVIDGGPADVELTGDLGVGQALAGQVGDALLLGGELVEAGVAAAVGGDPGGGQLMAGPGGERRSAHD